ncbi:MAG: hypothetical protein DWQ34_06875 [Planctomycetota bacterium]|nr:MAG: hypothetical protein DWQ34_06875 [Planctomycetota bacterium]REK26563.1 MAG: hypothetical protein DWQ41_09900 [Planctomycetota bacterium]REK34050.1 MAG: hypothetical protein DWQ45_13865 [Planctomycetota bacterium]
MVVVEVLLGEVLGIKGGGDFNARNVSLAFDRSSARIARIVQHDAVAFSQCKRRKSNVLSRLVQRAPA